MVDLLQQATLALLNSTVERDQIALALALQNNSVEKVTWEYANDDNSGWKKMSTFYSDLHEENWTSNNFAFQYDVQYGPNNEKNYHYVVDLTNWLQTNTNTGKVRRIRRAVEREIAT